MYARAKLHDGLQITLARQSVFDTLGLKREYSSFVFNDAGRRAQCYYSHVEIQKSERRETIKVYALPCHPDCLGCPNCVSESGAYYWESMTEDIVLGYHACKALIGPREAEYRGLLDFHLHFALHEI